MAKDELSSMNIRLSNSLLIKCRLDISLVISTNLSVVCFTCNLVLTTSRGEVHKAPASPPTLLFYKYLHMNQIATLTLQQ